MEGFGARIRSSSAVSSTTSGSKSTVAGGFKIGGMEKGPLASLTKKTTTTVSILSVYAVLGGIGAFVSGDFLLEYLLFRSSELGSALLYPLIMSIPRCD